MRRQDAEYIVGRLRYKPGRTFEWSIDSGDQLVLRVTWDAVNARQPTKLTTVMYTYVTNIRDMSERRLMSGIVEWLSRLEKHELLEWLYFGNQRFQDPHAAGFDPDGSSL